MKIVVTVTGGWSGLRSSCVVDTACLTKAYASQVEHAFVSCATLDTLKASAGTRDARTYVVESPASGRIVRISESSAAPEATELLRILRPLCRDMP